MAYQPERVAFPSPRLRQDISTPPSARALGPPLGQTVGKGAYKTGGYSGHQGPSEKERHLPHHSKPVGVEPTKLYYGQSSKGPRSHAMADLPPISTEDDMDSAYSSDLVSSPQQISARTGGSHTSQRYLSPTSSPALTPSAQQSPASHAGPIISTSNPSSLSPEHYPPSSSPLPSTSPSTKGSGFPGSQVSPPTAPYLNADLVKLKIGSQTDLPFTDEPAAYAPSIVSPKPTYLSSGGPGGDTRSTYLSSPSQVSLPGLTPPPSPSPSSPPPRLRPEAVSHVEHKVQGREQLVSRDILDPTLRSTLLNFHVPHQISNIANVALSGLASGPKTRFNTTIGVPIDGLARDLKGLGWKVEGRYEAEHGGVEVSMGVVRSGRQEGEKMERIEKVDEKKSDAKEKKNKKTGEKGRKMARVEVETKGGGILIDITEIDKHRQIDLRIETKTGDVLLLLPDNFLGPIHVKSPHPPEFLPALLPLLKPTANPYQNLHTTYMVPIALSSKANSTLPEHAAAQQIDKYVPKVLRKESDILDQLTGGYVSHVRKGWSKVVVTNGKGRVVVGLRESGDVRLARGMGLKVGREGVKEKKWWQLGS
ncbi:hypothetical protein I350_03972 [Cryptococcus amylolentus CBS 6273]|uniref:DUF7330 domain-containing protein n=1 Tax=Cryptococcus amylolentus CBS 6273 TaxID=1296118 RepID=A0A1E3K0P3_9TREE|nr:hypothetical protein I350_03972 [Cryptococcus amylolentus CBS 6273]